MSSCNATAPEVSAAYPPHWVASWPLGVAHSITVRPIRPEDIALETEFARKLSKETRYNRFLGGGVRLTPEMLEKFTRIDFSRDMALIATATIEGAETAIGVARYARLADGVTCEFAITVADAWQGRGIGRKLLVMLVDSARGHGMRWIVVTCSPPTRPCCDSPVRRGFASIGIPRAQSCAAWCSNLSSTRCLRRAFQFPRKADTIESSGGQLP